MTHRDAANSGIPIFRPRLSLAVMVSMVIAGCDSGPPTAPVSGIVTYNGTPVETGNIYFHPTDGSPAVGTINSDGSYSLSRKVPGDGAILGEYQVTIEAKRVNAPEMKATSLLDERNHAATPAGRVKVEYLVPPKYASVESSDLTATVTARSNEINFDLP